MNLAALTALAGLAALAFTQHLGAELYARPTAVRSFEPSPQRATRRGKQASGWSATIVRRDLFDSDPPPFTAEARPDQCGHDPALATLTAPNTFVIAREALRELARKLARFCRQVCVRPHLAQGLRIGYELCDLPPRGIYRRLGFCSGDVLVAIDGRFVTSPTKALEVYEQLARLDVGDRLEVTVLRGRHTATLRYTTR